MEWRARRKTDNSLLGVHDPPVIVRDASNGFIKAYDLNHREPTISLKMSSLKSPMPVVASGDLLPANIYIARPSFLGFAVENFDRTSIYSLLNAIISDELMQKAIGVYVLEPVEVACPIDCLRNFHATNMAYMRRFLHPYTPSCPPLALEDLATRRLAPRNGTGLVYQQVDYSALRDSDLSPDSTIVGPVLLGPGTIVEPRALVRESIVARGCRLCTNSLVASSFLMQNVHVAAHAKVNNCLLMSDVYIGEKAELVSGTIVAPGTRIPPGYKQTTPGFLTNPPERLAPSADARADLSFDGSYSPSDESSFCFQQSPLSSISTTPCVAKDVLTRPLFEGNTHLYSLHGFAGSRAQGRLACMSARAISTLQLEKMFHSPRTSPRRPPQDPQHFLRRDIKEFVFMEEPCWDRLWETIREVEKMPGQLERASEKVFNDEVTQIIRELVHFQVLRADQQEKLRLDLQNARLSANMDHQDCFPAILHGCLRTALEHALRDVKEDPGQFMHVFLMNAMRYIAVLWPVVEGYIPEEMHDQDLGFTLWEVELLYVVQTFVEDNFYEAGVPGRSNFTGGIKLDKAFVSRITTSLFFNFFNSKTLPVSEPAFLSFFEDLRTTGTLESTTFLKLCASFERWLAEESEGYSDEYSSAPSGSGSASGDWSGSTDE